MLILIMKSDKMVRHAIDSGVNYLDTGYTYHSGNSEAFCKAVMQDGYRDKVYIADKLPSWEVNKYEDMERLLDEQLDRLGVDTIDFLFTACIGSEFLA